MRRVNLKYIALTVLVLFVAGLGIRRYIMRSQIAELGNTINELRSQDELQERLNEFMAAFMKSDADLKSFVISKNPEFIAGFDDQMTSLEDSFSLFLELAAYNQIISAIDTARVDSLVAKKILFMRHINGLCKLDRYQEAEMQIATGAGIILMDSIWNIVHRSSEELDDIILENEREYRQRSRSEELFSVWSFIVLVILLISFLFFLHREIGKNEQIRNQLSDREEKLTVTLAGISDGVLTTDEKGHINYLNPVAQQLLDGTLADVSGKHLNEVYRIADEASGEHIDNIFEQVVVAGKEIERRNHTILYTLKNEVIVIENSATPLRNYNDEIIGMVLVFRDVTEQRDNIMARLEAEKDFRIIFENTQEGIYRSTIDGKLLLVNPSMTRIFDFDTPDHMLREVHDIKNQLYVNDLDREKVVYTLKEKGRVIGMEFQAKTRKGKTIWIKLNAHLVRDMDGRIDYVEGSVMDVTQRKLDQENLKKQYEALREYAFINSHQVRAHVATMLGLMHLCNAKYVDDNEKEKVLMHLNEETQRLDQVIRKLSKLIN